MYVIIVYNYFNTSAISFSAE